MRISILLLVLLSCGLNSQKSTDFDWLIGKWERENVRPGRTAFEIWEREGELLSGIGVTLEGTDTVFVEKLSIISKEGQFYYVADVTANTAPTLFKISDYNADGFVSENPEHDFPKKIMYTLDGNKMLATISGDGKEIPFAFKRVD